MTTCRRGKMQHLPPIIARGATILLLAAAVAGGERPGWAAEPDASQPVSDDGGISGSPDARAPDGGATAATTVGADGGAPAESPPENAPERAAPAPAPAPATEAVPS